MGRKTKPGDGTSSRLSPRRSGKVSEKGCQLRPDRVRSGPGRAGEEDFRQREPSARRQQGRERLAWPCRREIGKPSVSARCEQGQEAMRPNWRG